MSKQILSSVTQREEVESLKTDVQAAAFYGCSVALFRKWRVKGGGPRYLKLNGKLIRYSMRDLLAYLETCAAGGASKVSDGEE